MTYYEYQAQVAKSMKLEQKVGKVLDKEFYEPLFTEWKRNNTNIEAQKRGIDARANLNGELIYIDEKAGVKYWNRNLSTFAIEVDNGHVKPWFKLSDDNYQLTTHYLFVWLRATDETLDDITSFDAYLVPKQKIRAFMEEINLTQNDIDNFQYYANEVDKWGRPYMTKYALDGDPIKILQSKVNGQTPINVLIPKYKLAEMAVKTITYQASAW